MTLVFLIQTLNQGDAQSLRITENSGISFIYTLEK